MIDLFEKLLEVSYSGLKRKQKSITRLFPTFYQRVKDVGGRGGVRLVDQKLGEWIFKVHSGTKNGTWYDVNLKFKNLDSLLEKLVTNRKLWKKDKSGVNFRKLSHELIYKMDLQLKCSCPAFLYWGSAYILSLSKYNAIYGDPEIRSPKIRNPKKYGAYCKHIEALMKVLPFYENTMAKYLKDHYAKVIAVYEEAIRREYGEVKKIAKHLELKKKETEEEKPEEEEQSEEEKSEEVPEEENVEESRIQEKNVKINWSSLTDNSYYDSLIKNSDLAQKNNLDVRIEKMSPEKYLKLAAKIDYSSVNAFIKDASSNTVDHLVNILGGSSYSGYEIYLPFIDFVKKYQEGRHRALAARFLRVKQIPVLIVRRRLE